MEVRFTSYPKISEHVQHRDRTPSPAEAVNQIGNKAVERFGPEPHNRGV